MSESFEALFERHRGELRVHCYRMLGSYDEAEDLVQETFLRAWKNLDSFQGRSSVRTWLYKIATNGCLDALDGRARRILPHELAPGSAVDIAWLQPFPTAAEPADLAIERETLELAFLIAIQHLPPRQRAVLLLRDVLGWPAKETASLLDGSVASVNSALQRARTTLKEHLPRRRTEWTAQPTEQENAVLRRYMEAVERADLAAVAELLAADVRATMPPYLEWHQNRDEVMAAYRTSWNPESPEYVGRFRMVPTHANGRPAVAVYVRRPQDRAYQATAICVLRIEGDRVTEMTAFHDPHLFAAFGLASSYR
jgi:RNA polymerase sigma-70 factor (ECF subfamily)